MPRYNVEYKGQWACFASIVDAFITKFMSKSDYDDWRKHEYSEYSEHNNLSLEKCNMITMEEATFSITLNRNREEAINVLFYCGLPELECKQIMYDVETKYYSPILKDNGDFECPNCGVKVEHKKETCDNETCCIDFAWRD